jgi:hypothetical protein
MLTILASVSPAQVRGSSQAKIHDDHFTCAAMISAADHLIVSGRAPADAAIRSNGLVASMRHLNAWAIPNGLRESDAFSRVKKERGRLLGNLSGSKIVARAKVCIRQLP